jgi:hypothetical protein
MNASVVSQKKFERKYPQERAKIEAKAFPIDTETERVVPNNITKKDIKDSYNVAVQDGFGKKKISVLPQYFSAPLKTAEPENPTLLIDYQTINEQKRRMSNGKMIVLTPEEFATMDQLDKVKLQGRGDFYMLYPGQFSKGNIEIQGPATGPKRKPILSQVYANTISGS